MTLPIRLTQLILTAAAFTLGAGTSFAQCAGETFKLLAIDGTADDYFGGSLATNGTTAIVGAWGDDDNGPFSGSAYLFDITTGLQLAKILPDDIAAGDEFGSSVAISGTIAIVGAPRDDDNGLGSGSAYLFDVTSGLQLAKLLPSDGATWDKFGSSVAISGTTAIIGAAGDDDNSLGSGAAYLFDVTSGLQLAKLLPTNGAAQDQFGSSVAISGTIAIVGAKTNDENGYNSGSAYLFDVATGLQIAKLLPSDGSSTDYFGLSVAISGTTAVVGAPFHAPFLSPYGSGSAYLFDATTGLQVAKLLPNNATDGENFGYSVAINSSTVIVGAQHNADNGFRSGSAYLFDITTGVQLAKLLPGDGVLMIISGCPSQSAALPQSSERGETMTTDRPPARPTSWTCQTATQTEFLTLSTSLSQPAWTATSTAFRTSARSRRTRAWMQTETAHWIAAMRVRSSRSVTATAVTKWAAPIVRARITPRRGILVAAETAPSGQHDSRLSVTHPFPCLQVRRATCAFH